MGQSKRTTELGREPQPSALRDAPIHTAVSTGGDILQALHTQPYGDFLGAAFLPYLEGTV